MEQLTRKEMKNIFGTMNGNWLTRQGIFSIVDAKNYFEKYPFDKYGKYKEYYRNIGPVRYKEMIETLNKLKA